MQIKIKIIVGIIIVCALIQMIRMVKKKKLELKYALIWIIMGVGVLFLTYVPGLMEWLSDCLGIVSPMNMMFFLGFLFTLVIVFTLSIAVSDMSVKLKQLTQECALRERDLEEMRAPEYEATRGYREKTEHAEDKE